MLSCVGRPAAGSAKTIGIRDTRAAEEHASGTRIREVRVRLEGVSRTANRHVVPDASSREPPVQISQIAEHPKLRREPDRERRRVAAGIVGQRIDLRADVASDELIQGADAEMPVRVDVVLDAKLPDARREVETGVRLSVPLPRWIGRVGRQQDERAPVCSRARR